MDLSRGIKVKDALAFRKKRPSRSSETVIVLYGESDADTFDEFSRQPFLSWILDDD